MGLSFNLLGKILGNIGGNFLFIRWKKGLVDFFFSKINKQPVRLFGTLEYPKLFQSGFINIIFIFFLHEIDSFYWEKSWLEAKKGSVWDRY